MFSRASHPVRVCFKPLGERAGLSDLLGELDLGREASRSDRLLDTVIDADGRVAVCVDVSPEGVHRRIGFELHAPRDRAASGFFADLLDPLSRNVEIDRPKTDAFLAIEGWAELADESGCHREINHLKIVTRPDAATELKGYLALSRRTAPSFQPTGR